MKKVISIFFLLSYSIIVYGSNCKHSHSSLKCVKYISNYDGDTITFDIPNTHPIIGERVSIRVNGVDTAEIKGKARCEKNMAIKTREFVKALLVQAKNIELRNIKRGKYFRIVADVIIDGESLKDSLTHYKLAIPYDGGTKQQVNWCRQIEKVKKQLASEGFPISKKEIKK